MQHRPAWRPTCLILLLLGTGSCAQRLPQAASAIDGEHLRVRLICDAQALLPGTTHQIGVLFTIQPGWHLYGPSRSDSGLPILIRASAPDGFTLHAPLWPAPQRLVSSGSILDHVYPDEVTALLPLDIPSEARPGGTVTLHCHAEWLVCGSGCVPGQGDLRITLPIGRPGEKLHPSPDEVHILAAQARIPKAQELLASMAESCWSTGSWHVTVHGATSLAFYPDTTCAPLRDPIHDAASSSDQLCLRLAENAPPAVHVAGILEVATPRGSSFYQIDTSPPSAIQAGL